MLNKFKFLIISTSLLLSATASAVELEKLVEARQGFMLLNAVNMDILGDMIKGRAAYNRTRAQAAANNLLALARMQNGALWPNGSSVDNPALKDKTRARAAIWQERQTITELQAELEAALAKLAQNAGWSLDALEENFADAAAACRACHKEYRIALE